VSVARGWSGWNNLGGDLTSSPAVALGAPDHLEVFVRGLDNHLVWRRWNGSTWSGWINLGGDLAGGPAVTSLGPSSLEVFVRGLQGNDLVWRRWNGSTWGGWINLGGDLSSSPAVVSIAPDRLEVFVRGADTHLVWRRWNGSTWSGWINLGGDLAAAPTVTSLGPSSLEVFVRGLQGNDLLWRRWDGSTWSGWINLGGTLTSSPAATSIASGHLEVLARKEDEELVWRRWDGSAWSGWINLGGDLADAPGVPSADGPSLEVFVHGLGGNDLVWRRFPERVGRWGSIGPTRITRGTEVPRTDASRNSVGRVTTIAVHPTSPSTIYVGARGSGLWKTDDGGSSWRPITDSLPTVNVRGVAIDPSAHSRLYLATGVGVFRSDDAGSQWIQLSTGDLNARVVDGGALLVDPSDPTRLFLTSEDGVYRSTTSGASWEFVLSGGRAGSLVMNPTTPAQLHAALANDNDSSVNGIYQSDDSGASWRKLTGCPGARLPTVSGRVTIRCARSGSRLYASFKTTSSWTLYRTTGIGCSIDGRLEDSWEPKWSPTGSINGDPIFKRLWSWLYADPVDPNIVYAGGTDVWVSRDGGASFSRSEGPHADHHAFVFHPQDSKVVYTGCDGGLYRSSDRANSWTFRSEGLANVELYDLAHTAGDPNMVIGGTQDNAVVRRVRESRLWERRDAGPRGDVECVFIHASSDRIFYALNQFMDQINRSPDGGDNWWPIGEGMPESCDIWNGEYPSTPFNHFIAHPGKPTVLLATCGSLWIGLPWRRALTPDGESVTRVAVDATLDLYYAGTDQGNLYAAQNVTGWELVFEHPDQQRLLGLTVDPEEPTVLWATFEGSGAGRVYQLRRDPTAPTSLQSRAIGAGLPADVTPYAIAADPLSPRTIYAGTNAGVFRAVFNARVFRWAWAPYNDGLPPADVRSLEPHPVTGVLRAGTFGRGAYEVLTAAVRTKASAASPTHA
jgi:hypothetical protein